MLFYGIVVRVHKIGVRVYVRQYEIMRVFANGVRVYDTVLNSCTIRLNYCARIQMDLHDAK